MLSSTWAIGFSHAKGHIYYHFISQLQDFATPRKARGNHSFADVWVAVWNQDHANNLVLKLNADMELVDQEEVQGLFINILPDVQRDCE